MSSQFIAYIDEAGDEGFKFLPGEKGSSRWFVLSALIVRKSNDNRVVQVARQARTLFGKPDKFALHFRDLGHERRLPLARMIGLEPFKTIHILVHKPSIQNPENFQQEAHRLYRYLTRLLIERISWLCRDSARDGDSTADLVFSNRSAMSYEELRDYINLLFRNDANGQQGVNIDWNVIDSSRVRAVNHDKLAGLQLADAVASSAYYAVNRSQYGEVEEGYLRLLAKTFYRNRGTASGYGLKSWCGDAQENQRLALLASLRE